MPQYAYFQKKFMPLSEAKLGIMTNFMHYGTAVFEGIRGNWNEVRQQIYLFRLKEHYERLLNGCKVLKMQYPIGGRPVQADSGACGAQRTQGKRLYPSMGYKSSEAMGVRLHNLEADFFVFVMPWGRYLDTDKSRRKFSSWRRPGGNYAAPQAKITGQYYNSAFAKTEAYENGYDEAILLNENGRVAEGSGENIFLVIDGQLLTPSIYENILIGITRNSVMDLAREELGIEVVERPIEHMELYVAQEAFYTGTATHIAPIVEIDHRRVGDGEIGPITARLQELYHSVIEGRTPRYMKWCVPVY